MFPKVWGQRRGGGTTDVSNFGKVDLADSFERFISKFLILVGLPSVVREVRDDLILRLILFSLPIHILTHF